MLGLFAMLLGCAALVVVGSYWIFWEMESVTERPQFAAKLWADFTGLFARERPARATAIESLAAVVGVYLLQCRLLSCRGSEFLTLVPRTTPAEAPARLAGH